MPHKKIEVIITTTTTTAVVCNVSCRVGQNTLRNSLRAPLIKIHACLPSRVCRAKPTRIAAHNMPHATLKAQSM